MSDNVFDKSIWSYIAGQIGNYHAHAGRYDLAVDFVYDDVVIGIVHYLVPCFREMVVVRRNAVIV